MDLNRAYSAHQHALMMAEQAGNATDRNSHLAQATKIATRIRTFQLDLGAAAACAWSASQLSSPTLCE